MNGGLQWAGLIGGIVALCQVAWQVYRGFKGGELRKSQAEAAKAHLDTAQAEASLPHIQRSLELGNVAEAVAIQQGIINGLRDHAKWQDGQIEERDGRIVELERRLTERDEKIEELAKRLISAEVSLATAKRLIGELRTTRYDEK